MKNIILLSLILIICKKTYSQDNCNTSQPFCSGTTYTNTTVLYNESSSAGVSFGCVNANYSNPSSKMVYFFYGQAKNNGIINLKVSDFQNNSLIVWGSFNTLQNTCNSLSNQNILDCMSYPIGTSSLPVDDSISFNIQNGKYYVFAVTPTQSTSVTFTLQQSSGNGILCIDACSKPIATPTVCYITSNSTNNNEIYFNNYSSTFKMGTVIFRESSTNVWDSIGFVPANQPNKFTDVSSNNNQQAYMYKLAHIDSCGKTQLFSNNHKTIHLQSSLGTGSQINLSWNSYLGLTVNNYYIFRGSTPNNLQFLTTVSGSINTFTDLTPLIGTNFYKIGINLPTNCSSNVINSDSLIYSNQRSTISTNVLENINNVIISVYPNPTKHSVTITTKFTIKHISIIDITGKEILNIIPKSTTETINIENISSGIYFIKVEDKNALQYQKLIID